MAAVARAEIAWLHALVADLREGRLKFPTRQEMQKLVAKFQSPEEEPREEPRKRRAKR
jgi:hypothetical protein